MISTKLLGKIVIIITLSLVQYNPLSSKAGQLLSAGDEVSLDIADDKIFSGEYIISDDGYLHIPFLDRLHVNGLTLGEAHRLLNQAFTSELIFKSSEKITSLRRTNTGSIVISVSGEVFNSGYFILKKFDETPGYNKVIPRNRSLFNALKAADGITPYADLSKISITRNNEEISVDIRDLMKGNFSKSIELVDGDHIHVRSSNSFNEDLVKPSLITPKIIKVFIATNDSPYSGENKVPYGSRVSHALSVTGCVDKNQFLTRKRKIMLVRDYPNQNNRQVYTYTIGEILSKTQKSQNILLQPYDVIVCDNSVIDKITSGLLNLTNVIGERWPFYEYYLRKDERGGVQ